MPMTMPPRCAVQTYALLCVGPLPASPPTITLPSDDIALALPRKGPPGVASKLSTPFTQRTPRHSPVSAESQPTMTEPSALTALARLEVPSRLPRLTILVLSCQRKPYASQPSQPRPTTTEPSPLM